MDVVRHRVRRHGRADAVLQSATEDADTTGLKSARRTRCATLRRELGKWDLTALGVNQVIGGAVFAVPATLALSLGSWSWLAVGVVGLLAMAVALNFAEAGSRFDGTGGPYLYTRAAFGRFAEFRSRLDGLGRPRHELVVGRERARQRARLLLAGGDDRLCARRRSFRSSCS